MPILFFETNLFCLVKPSQSSKLTVLPNSCCIFSPYLRLPVSSCTPTMSANFQDWTPVVLKKGSPSPKRTAKEQEINKARRAGEEIEIEKKFLGGCNKATKARLCPNAKKVEEDTGDYHVDRVSPDFSKALAEARRNKGMTQAQLAQAINEKPSVISEYESGKAIPNGVILQKMSKALGCQLPKCTQKKKVVSE